MILGRAVILSVCFIACWGTDARASDQVDRFIKRCNAYVNTEGEYWNLPRKLKIETSNLAKEGVPIRLLLTKCDFVRHEISLRNGSKVFLESGFPTQEDPDTKSSRYQWDSQSPSKKHWLFRFYGWEWAGWLLVDKLTGQLIETPTECSNAPIQLMRNLLATVCMGNYDNEQPTIYVADLAGTKIRWSEGLPLHQCQKGDTFRARGFIFLSDERLHVSGECVSDRSHEVVHRIKVNQVVLISTNGLTTLTEGETATVGWK